MAAAQSSTAFVPHALATIDNTANLTKVDCTVHARGGPRRTAGTIVSPRASVATSAAIFFARPAGVFIALVRNASERQVPFVERKKGSFRARIRVDGGPPGPRGWSTRSWREGVRRPRPSDRLPWPRPPGVGRVASCDPRRPDERRCSAVASGSRCSSAHAACTFAETIVRRIPFRIASNPARTQRHVQRLCGVDGRNPGRFLVDVDPDFGLAGVVDGQPPRERCFVRRRS